MRYHLSVHMQFVVVSDRDHQNETKDYYDRCLYATHFGSHSEFFTTAIKHMQ